MNRRRRSKRRSRRNKKRVRVRRRSRRRRRSSNKGDKNSGIVCIIIGPGVEAPVQILSIVQKSVVPF